MNQDLRWIQHRPFVLSVTLRKNGHDLSRWFRVPKTRPPLGPFDEMRSAEKTEGRSARAIVIACECCFVRLPGNEICESAEEACAAENPPTDAGASSPAVNCRAHS